ncbi:MAG: hypothetical protein FJ137_07990 [Deltaproteobacteria bacterium]|nr:hypothetical protein [Deltaproteobacteria bacterium]
MAPPDDDGARGDAPEGDLDVDPWARDDARWRETWHEDETAPKTTQGRLAQMGRALRRLTRECLAATLAVAVLIGLLEAWNGVGFPHSTGFLLGGGLATVNLWLLAGGYFAVVDGRAALPRVALAAVGSLSTLLAVAVWVVFSHPAWALGFGVGLAVPALGGIIHGLRGEQP